MKREEDIARLLRDPDLPYNQIVRIPAVLYFPPEVLGQLNDLCQLRELSPRQLIAEAFESQIAGWDQFCEEVMTPLKPGESESWPEDPLYALACVTPLHLMSTFVKMMEDPIGFEQLKKDAPADWSFRSPEQDADPADWWKEDE